MENKRRRADGQGCEDCPPCYNLVQDAVNQHRKELKELDDVSSEINITGLLRVCKIHKKLPLTIVA